MTLIITKISADNYIGEIWLDNDCVYQTPVCPSPLAVEEWADGDGVLYDMILKRGY